MGLRFTTCGDRSEARLSAGRVGIHVLVDRIHGWPGGGSSAWRWSIHMVVDGGWHHMMGDSYRPTQAVAHEEASAAVVALLDACAALRAQMEHS